MDHVVMYSGGIGSWAAAKRVSEWYGPDRVVLLFADTRMEDPDLYRFIEEGAEDIGAKLVKVAEGRDPWEVFKDKRFLGNSRIDPCSLILKRKFLRRWLEDRYEPDEVVVHLGIDIEEEHRFRRAQRYWEPYTMRAPLIERPTIFKFQVREMLKDAGIRIPRLYELGFPHNNCGGFCIKAGLSHFHHLLKMLPDRFAYHEAKEQEMREYLDRPVTILRETRHGEKVGITLRELRERAEAAPEQIDLFDWGGCGCFGGEEDG